MLQEYLQRLKAQKSGSGEDAFNFYNNDKSRDVGIVDDGFTKDQMQMVDDTEEVMRFP